ncbi:MAG TPA: hypothetical protein VF520_13055 [Thermoleophilaceae bacterium]|jgi:hypothetical protein
MPDLAARVLLASAAAQVAGWALVLAARCPDDDVCTGAGGSVSQAGGLMVYVSFAAFLLVGVAVLVWAAAAAMHRLARRRHT